MATANDKKRRCRTCLSLGTSERRQNEIEFECRRNPPVVPHPRDIEGHRWPYVFPDQEWCDSWQEAPVVNPFGEPSVVKFLADDEDDDNDEDDRPDWPGEFDTEA